MGKVSKYFFSKEINPEPDEHANHLQIELSHDGYHIHFRNLRIVIKPEEMKMWKKAFAHAKGFVENQNLL
jgi:hypothetical protein